MAPGELKILAWVVTDLQKKNGLNPPKELFLALYCQSTMRWINFLRGINIWQLFRIIDATSDINSTQKVDESKNAWDFSSEALTDFKILFFWGITIVVLKCESSKNLSRKEMEKIAPKLTVTWMRKSDKK